jgi:hypothetical protein
VEAIEQYANTKPMPASSLEWLMGLVAERRQEVDEILGFQVSETLLYTLGRVQPTPDAEIADEGVINQRWTGD